MPSSQANSVPVYFQARGLSDTLDATGDFDGAMASLQNLVFDPTSAHVVQCRPASIELLAPHYPNPILSFGFVSIFEIVGDMLYGMVASKDNPGRDRPFALNLLNNSVVDVSGFTAANTPATLPASGDWTPPTASVIGTKVVFTHPGFASGTFATATDKITFSANPTPGDTLTFGTYVTDQASLPGTLVTFVASSPIAADGQVLIGANLAATLTNLLTFLQGSGDSNLGALTYAVVGSELDLSYVTPGADGNGYPVSSSSANAVVATPTLQGGSGCYFAWIDISNPAAPVYNAGNCAINPLPSIPVAVAQFNSRAYFICNPTGAEPGLIPSDPLQATVRTNGSYVLTFGDNEPLTALAGLPLTNQLGGIIQSLIVFKGVDTLYQITGDPLPNTSAGSWAKNSLNVATGTLSPRSIAPSPIGLLFMSPQGLRNIDFNAQVSPPIGADGKGVSLPFIHCPLPSRIAAACNAKYYRVSLTTEYGQQWEFWLDLGRQVWTGPHTFPANMIAPYENTFILAPMALNNSIWQSDWLQDANSTFTEAGLQMVWNWQPSLFPDPKDMRQHEMHQSILNFCSASGADAYIADEAGGLVASATLPASGGTSSWSAPLWQGSLFYGQKFSMSPIQIPWSGPIVIGRACLQVTGNSDSVTRIGSLMMRVEQTGYLPQPGS